MPLTYHNTRTGRVRPVPTPDEAAARSETPKRTRRQQEKIIAKLDESTKWNRTGGDPAVRRGVPDPAPVPGPAVRHDPAPTGTDLGHGHADTPPSDPTEPDMPEPSLADVRAWAEAAGIEVSARGRISKDVIDAFKAAQTEGAGGGE